MAQITPGKDLVEREEEAEERIARGPLVPAPAGPADDAPAGQLGVQRFVYATFMAGALLVAFLLSKITDGVWHKLAQYKPTLGEPQEEAVYTISALIGIGVAFYVWRKQAARDYVEEVATELSKVTWPDKKEVTNSTVVVVITTLVSTTFFALMDQFWRFVTDHVYSL